MQPVKSLVAVAVAGTLLASFPHGAFAASATVIWDLEPDPTVNGYNLYYGPAPANYTNVISAGLTNQVVVNGLVAGSTNFFVVTALNIYGIESLFSDPPVVYVVPFSNSVVNLNGLTQTYDGGPKPVSVTTIPVGLSVVVTYNGLSTLPVNAGQYQVVATVVDPVYTGSASNTLTITKAPLTILFGNLDWNYDGTPKSVQVQTTPAVNVDLTYNDSPTPPTQPGTYVVVAIVDDPNYQGAATNLMTITYSKPTPPLTAPAIPYPDNQTLDVVSQLSPVPQTLLTWPRTQNRLVLFQSADLRTWVPLTNVSSSANSIALQQTSSTRYYRAEELAPAGSRPVPLSIRTK